MICSKGEYLYDLNVKETGLVPGIYFVKLIVDGKTGMKRMIVTE
jgi:hypothetical protein